MRFGMVIDLRRCMGVAACIMACKVNNALPKGVFNTRLVDYEEGTFPNVKRRIIPVQCNHCENPPCVPVCPTGASHVGPGGVVKVDPAKCIGCASCIMACPYGAIQPRTLYKEFEPYYGILTEYDKVVMSRWTPGTVIKCDFCFEKVYNAVMRGLRPGVDPDATPYCVLACPNGAKIFGDLDDPESPVSQVLRREKDRVEVLNPEYGTRPKVFYIRP